MRGPPPSGSTTKKSSRTCSISNGTCCSASHGSTARASSSGIRSTSIRLVTTSLPPSPMTTSRGSIRSRFTSEATAVARASELTLPPPAVAAPAGFGATAIRASLGTPPERSTTAALQ